MTERRITVKWIDGETKELVIDHIVIKKGIVHFMRGGMELMAAPKCSLREWGRFTTAAPAGWHKDS